MQNFYISFGQAHRHEFEDVIIDKDCVVQIPAEDAGSARDKAFELFGDKWSFMYSDGTLKLQYFPRGIIQLRRLENETR